MTDPTPHSKEQTQSTLIKNPSTPLPPSLSPPYSPKSSTLFSFKYIFIYISLLLLLLHQKPIQFHLYIHKHTSFLPLAPLHFPKLFCFGVYATAVMLRLCPSLPKQSNPSILTVAVVAPNFIILPPPPPAGFRTRDGDAAEEVAEFWLPNWASWVRGLEALLGGDPQKYGGDDANWWPDLSDPCNKKNRYEDTGMGTNRRGSGRKQGDTLVSIMPRGSDPSLESS